MIDESHFPQTINDYVFIKRIAHGGSARCYLVESIKFEINKLFVAKVIPTSQFLSISAENKALMELNHPNVIKLYDRFALESYYVFILEYCENNSLAEAIIPDIGISGYKSAIGAKYEQTDLDFFKNCAYQIVNALSYCHFKKCAHRDIKPSNVLIDHYWKMKLSDFGLSVKYQNDDSLDYEYEYEEEDENESKNNCKDEKSTKTNNCQIPLMSPITNDTATEKFQNVFKTNIYYLNNVQVKTRKLSSDTEQAKLNENLFTIKKNEKPLNHRERQILRARSFSDNIRLVDNRTNVINKVKTNAHPTKRIKKKRKILCNSFCGSLVYTAPEIILRQSYDPFSADIWSLGVLFIVMLTGKSPWEGKGQEQIQQKILKRDISPDVLNKIPSDLIELIDKMIVVDPSKRYSIEEIRSSPFFDDPSILFRSPPKHKKIKMLQQKSHSYNSSLGPAPHYASKFFNKNRNILNPQSQDQNSPFPSSFAQSPLAPVFKRLHTVKLPKSPMIQCSPSLNQKQIRSPNISALSNFKKSLSMKSNLPIINLVQTEKMQTIQNSDESNSNELQNQTKEQVESSNLLEQHQNEAIQSAQEIGENNQQNSQDSSFLNDGAAHISKCQSLHSPNIFNLSFFAKI